MLHRIFLYTMSFLLLCFTSKGQEYNYYFGNIHAHTGYSDGSKDSTTTGIARPGQAFWFAKQTYHLDFLGISEHNHASAGMRFLDYAKGKYESDTANVNGTFVAMYGMEYGVISNGGHVLLYGIDSLIGWDSINGQANYTIYNGEFDYSSIWDKVISRSKAFATLAHPNAGDYDSLDIRSFNARADQAIVGTAIRSGSAFSTTTDYTDPPATSYESMYKKYLAQGFKLAPTIDGDNHYTTFGRTGKGRTVVMARSLHRDSIMDAFCKMHFYASDDWNAQVQFTVAGAGMGSDIQSLTAPTINLSVADADGEIASSMIIYRGIVGSGTNAASVKSVSNTNTVTYSPTSFTTDTKYYYYAKITQADGDIIWTAPIWFSKVAALLPLEYARLSAERSSSSNEVDAQLIACNQSAAVSDLTLQMSKDGIIWTDITAFSVVDQHGGQFHLKLLNKDENAYFLRVKLNGDLDEYFSNNVFIPSAESAVKWLVSPNPTSEYLRVQGLFPSGNYQCSLFTEDGILVSRFEQTIFERTPELMFDILKIKSGTYLFDIFYNGNRKMSSSFVKQ